MSTATLPTFDSEFAQYLVNNPIQMLPVISMTQDQFFAFCQQNPELRFERTAQGELIIMAPSGGGSGKRNLSVGAQLYNWSQTDGTGEAYDSSTGFILPNGANRTPDLSWIPHARLSNLTDDEKEKFIPLCPDFLVEVMSPSDGLREAQEKMEEYLENGTQLGWLIYPKKKQVYVYRPGQPVEVYDDAQSLAGDPELPGFVLDLEPVWRL